MPPSGHSGSVTHDDIKVGVISRYDIAASYDYSFYQEGNTSFASPDAPFFLSVERTIQGIKDFSSRTYIPNAEWGSSRPALLYHENALRQRSYYGFNDRMEVSSVTLPDGNGRTLYYDERFNIDRIEERGKANGSESLRLVTAYTYPASCSAATQAWCNKPLTMTDPDGNVTEYSYNDRGQLLTETGPAPKPGAARPVTRNEYTERTAYILDGNGGLVAAGPPISLLTRTSQCLTTENCEGTPDEVVTEYDYGPVPGNGVPIYATNLLLRGVAVTAVGADGQMRTLRTCYGYNYFGEKISETSPRADLASCS